MSLKLNSNSINYNVATVLDLTSIVNPSINDTVVVTEEGRGGVFIYRADGTSNGGTIFDSSSTGKWHRQYEGSVNVKWFGAKGDGVTDDTIALQNALNIGGIITFSKYKTYLYSALTIINNTLFMNGSQLKHITPTSIAQEILIGNNVYIDNLIITCTGGDISERIIHIVNGNNVRIDFVDIISANDGVYNKISYAIEIDTGTNIHFGEINVSRMNTTLFAKNVNNLYVGKGTTKHYRVAYYLRNVSNSTIENVLCEFTSTACRGIAGENGILVESETTNGTYNLHFNNCTICDSGEHSYRLGGSLTINNVWFNNCRSVRSGSAILVNNTAATSWIGGCGFKVLGGASVEGQKHKNIHFDNCIVEDINELYGTYPAGHGINNFSGFLIAAADNIKMSNCSVKKVQNTYSAANCIMLEAVDNIYINNCSFYDSWNIPLFIAQAEEGFAYANSHSTNINISNSVFSTTKPDIGYVLYCNNTEYELNGLTLSNCILSGANHAVRMETATSGSYSNINLNFTYINSLVDDNTYTEPIVYGAEYALLDVIAKWRPNAYGVASINGSKYTEPNGYYRIKYDGSYYLQKTKSGTYVPTLTNITNIDTSSVGGGFKYSMNGNMVSVVGRVVINATSASTFTQLEISLPISSNMTAYQECLGTAVAYGGSISGQITANPTTDKALLAFTNNTGTSDVAWIVSFTYIVI